MATSLAEQLQRLAVPQTTVLKRDKKRASLLFDPKEAAELKRDTFYQIGIEGLEELALKNLEFQKYKNTLFHITSKDFERSVQSAEANSVLNNNIREFLLVLSPYFLLSCSHKALEWLINRYSIHEYNREDMLMLILPYHESNIFVRVIQLLQFKDARDSYYFLKALQKPGVHLTKKGLLNYAASDVSFLKFVTKYITLLIKYNKTPNLLTVAFNFYCSVFTGAIEYSENITEEQVSHMLPLILKGLHSSVPDFSAASYIVTARLVAKISLSDKILDKFVEKITDVKVPQLKAEACLVLLVVYQSQTQYSTMPTTALENLSEKEWLPKILQNLNSSGSFILPFLERLVKKCTEEGTANDLKCARDMVTNCLAQIKFEENYIGTILNCILDSIKLKMDYSVDAKNWLTDLLQTLEKQYPSTFDKEVYRILTVTQEKELIKRKKCLSKILKNTLTYKGKFEIFDKLYHPNPKFRGEAVKYLLDNYPLLKENDRELIKNALVDRLNDQNEDVVKETLLIIKKIPLLKTENFRNSLISVLNKCNTDKHRWSTVQKYVIQMLCSCSNPQDWEVFLTIFTSLLPTSSEELIFVKTILQTPFISQNVLLKNSIENLQTVNKEEEFTKTVLKCLQDQSTWVILKEFLEVLKAVPYEKRDSFHKYVASLILSHILPDQTSFEVSVLILEILDTYYNPLIQENLKNRNANNNLHTEKYLECLENIITKTEKHEANLGILDFSIDGPDRTYFALILNILFKNSKQSRRTITIYLNNISSNLQQKIDFLLNLAISENKSLAANFKKKCLTYLLELLKSHTDNMKQLILTEEPTLPYLLILLSDTNTHIRKITFDILKLFMEKSPTEYYNFFLEGLEKHKEEIVIDHEQVPLIIFNIFNSTNVKAKKHTSYLTSIQSHFLQLCCNKDTPIYLKTGLLTLLSHINSFDILEKTAEVAINLLQKNLEIMQGFNAVFITNVINRIEDKLMSKLDLNTKTWHLIEYAVKNDKTVILSDTNDTTCLASLLLNNFKSGFFHVIKENMLKSLLNIIVEISSSSQNPEILPAANKIFKHIDLNAELIVDQLIQMRDVQFLKQNVARKKRRVSVVPTIEILDTVEWKKGITILEFIQDKKKMSNTSCLLPILFDILKKCLDFDEQAAVEYPKQLVLSLILHCCLRMDGEDIPENIFNMELVVQCIRASQNPQTHHHALLVLAHSASLIPTQVLHHMMAIFTFMGSSVLRHDDAYSFQIITKIVDTIIPILVQDNHTDNIAKVLRVFVDALLDVPEHRRIPLYKQLLTRFDVRENLHLFLLLIFESQVLHSSQEKHKDINSKKLEIAVNLCREFTPDIVIDSCIKLIKYLSKLSDDKEETMTKKSDTDDFAIITHTSKDFRHFKYLLLKFVANLLASQEFIIQVATLSTEEELSLESLYKEMIINILQYIQRISKLTEITANTPQAHYWKVVLHHSYDILDGINALLTPQMFLLVTKGLMVHNISTIRRRILELLNTKLQYNTHFFSECDKTEMYALIPPIISIIEGINAQVELEQETIIQTALLSLKLLIKSMAPEDPEKFVQILEFITNLIKCGKARNNVLASVLLCLAELCINLRAHALVSLADFMPAILKVLKQQKYEEIPSVLLRSSITTLEKILDSLPLFLSPYLVKLLVEISSLICKWGYGNVDQKLQPFINKLNCIKKKIGSVIPPRILIPAIEQSYLKIIEKKYFNAVSALMDILAENLSNLKGPDINANLPELTEFFLKALKLRSDGNSSLEEVNAVEHHIIQALTVLILKLSENSFRPMYYKLFDWAVRNDVKSERIITFYNLSNSIAQSLKSLFVLFAGYFLNNAAQILDACNKVKKEELYFEDETKSILLLEYVIKTLNSVFMYDNQKFINKERFDILMQALVDQLENNVGGTDELVKRNEMLLTPCLVNFTVATADDALWKQMNYQILLKMRHNSPQNRLVALYCLTEIVKRLGEDFLPLLPETIPFLAELLEDEEENVENACQKAVQEMEKVLGEPLQKYF